MLCIEEVFVVENHLGLAGTLSQVVSSEAAWDGWSKFCDSNWYTRRFVMRRFTSLPIQLSRLMGRKDKVVLASLPGLSIGLMSATRHGDGTSPDRQDRFAVARRQVLPFGEGCLA